MYIFLNKKEGYYKLYKVIFIKLQIRPTYVYMTIYMFFVHILKSKNTVRELSSSYGIFKIIFKKFSVRNFLRRRAQGQISV